MRRDVNDDPYYAFVIPSVGRANKTRKITPQIDVAAARVRREAQRAIPPQYVELVARRPRIQASCCIARPTRNGGAPAEAARAEPKPDADGWIPWAGGECPVDANVEVIIKDRSGKVWHFGVAGDYDWNHDEEPLDILFYRIVEARP